MLGYQPEDRTISAFEPVHGNRWRSLNESSAGGEYKQCVNYAVQDVCNWMLPADAPDELCASCQLTRIIPNLSSSQNRVYWKRLEAAKRRLLYTLWELHLQPPSKHQDPDAGLAFDFLEDMPNQPVMTGHASGLITLNVAEADPARREKMREQMHEPYRTLLGHFRHESGHYCFDRLIADTPWIEEFRDLFGNEQQDYGNALQNHYHNGPPADWDQRFISAYASAHPWEDWAETWAHYLHMFDTLDTAFACGMTLKPRKPDEPQLHIQARPSRARSFDDMVSEWLALSYVLNSLNRSIGMPDAYPFTMSPSVMQKLRFIDQVVKAYAQIRGA